MRGYWNTLRSGPSPPPPSAARLGCARQTSTDTAARSASKTASLDVAEVLAVGMQRKRDIAADLDPVEVVLAEEPAIVGVPAQDASCHRGQIRQRRNLDGSDEVETSIEGCLARDRQRQPACVRVWTAVRHEGGSGAPVALDLELRLEPASPLRELADDRPREREVAGPTSVALPAERVHPPHDVGRQPDAGAEGETPPVHPAERDPARPARGQRLRDLLRRRDGIARQAERAREHARRRRREESRSARPTRARSAPR